MLEYTILITTIKATIILTMYLQIFEIFKWNFIHEIYFVLI